MTLIGSAACLLLLIGCNEPPQIVTHRIPKSQSELEAFRPQTGGSGGGSPAAAVSKFPTPDGWTRGKSNPMFPSDKFTKVVDDIEVVLSIMPLPSSNDWDSNVQRWVGQVGMEVTSDEIDELSSEVEVDGIASQRIYLTKDDADSDSIIGVMAVRGNTAWFIKLMGNKTAVEASESEFDDYVDSLKIP